MSKLGMGLMAVKGYYDEDKRLAQEDRANRQVALQEQRFGLEQTRAGQDAERFGREQKQWKEQDDEKEGLKKVYEGSNYARVRQEKAARERAIKEWDAKKMAGVPDTQLGQRPDATEPTLTAADMLADEARMLDYQAQRGKYDPQAWASVAKRQQEIMNEGVASAAALLHRGDKDGAIAAFNKSGKVKIDPSAVVDFKPVKFNADGVMMDTYEITLKAPDGTTRTINAARELENVKALDGYIDRNLKARKAHNDDLETGAKVTSANASLANANANASLRRTQQQAAQFGLNQAQLAAAAREKAAAGLELTPKEKAALTGGTKEARNEYTISVDTLGNKTVLNKDTGEGVTYDHKGNVIGRVSGSLQANGGQQGQQSSEVIEFRKRYSSATPEQRKALEAAARQRGKLYLLIPE